METIKEALTFDDVLLLPKYSNVLPSDTNIYSNYKNITLKSFFNFCDGYCYRVKNGYSNSKRGWMGIIHRNLNIKNQSK